MRITSTIMAIVGKLRKLPHVFDKVLELPFRSDADVLIENSPENIRFVAKIDVLGSDHCIYDMSVRAVEIHPGVSKIVVRKCGPGGCHDMKMDKLNIDTWRYRLPRSAQPDMVSVVLVEGQLIVTVPKADDQAGLGGTDPWPGDSRLVLVQ